MKTSKIILGIGFVIIAILLILNAVGITFGIPEEIAVYKIILGGVFITFAIKDIIKLKIYRIFFPLTFTVMLFEKHIASLIKSGSSDIASAWEFLLIALLLTVGAYLLTPKRIRKKHSFKCNIGQASRRNTYYIDCSKNVNEHIENNMGFCEVFFTNIQMYSGNGIVNLENNMGRMEIHLPKDFTADIKIENNLGNIDIPEPINNSGFKILNSISISGENNLGQITVVYD